MASGAIGDSSNELNWRGRCRWTENSKVYTRKLHKKVQNTSNNTDTALSSTVASAATTEVSTAPTSKDPNDSASASPPPTTPASHSVTTASPRNAGDNAAQESQEAIVTKDAVSFQQRVPEQSPTLERSPSHSSANKNVDYSLQQPQLGDHQEHMPSLSEDNYSAEHGVQEGSGSQNVELHNHEDLLPPRSSETLNLKRPSPLPGPNETLQAGGDGPQCLRESSPLISENVLPNVREVAAPHFPVGEVLQNDEEMMPSPPQVPSGNGPAIVNGVNEPLVFSKVDDKVKFKLAKATLKDEVKELRNKLECELDQVRRLAKQLEAKELQLASFNTQISNSNLSNTSNYIGVESVDGGDIGGHSYPQPEHSRNDLVDRRVLLRLSSEGGVTGHPEVRSMGLARVNSDVGTTRNLEPRPYSRQLSVAVMENNRRAGEFVEKEKRTPKANQYYRNSEFLLGKDRLPSESIKRLKTNNGRKHSGETEHAFRLGFGFEKSRNQVFKSCSSLLQRLMKHKHGWVFNEPVDAKALGLVDYHDIIKHPMDLGTIKTRLSQNWYKSPREFAEDVRLVFRNAMTYNPKGQDVHIMAEQLSQIFEERWAIIETEYNPYWKYQMYQDAGLPTPTSRKGLPQSHFAPASVPALAPAPVRGSAPAAVQDRAHAPTSTAPIHLHAPAALQMRTSDRPETLTTPMAVDPKIQRTHVGRTPLPKKPKAKDPNKRDMTYEEKQRLSTNLQSLPSEKLDAIVQIIKKRNTALSQHDDEIEVDIDNVDAETLWELDRFVTNYKKSLSKNKRKAELALQARLVANQTAAPTNKMTAVADVRSEGGTVLEESTAPPAVEGENKGYTRSRSSSSSSSSSDSGSSSSDSDSDSSSGDGSDAGHSPGT
ncbi:transcription factor GTE4-like [Sesamum indicum]|uniref:Transcription factor GTE4-like n=1 Tax=Sesamum indicum TaxID=4182 RepID=A0A6I9TDL1_SESIN|nr:transcription factor GTE4-like [Sesamum indicum]XP_020550401.1 transcription factor GTE4-like [Sesamum indicum]